MSKRANGFHGILALVAVFSLLFTLGAEHAMAAQKTGASARVLVLPFQVSGSPEAQAQDDAFVQTLGRRIAAKGVDVVPHSSMEKLLETRNILCAGSTS